MICISDNAWFKLGLGEIIKNRTDRPYEVLFLTFQKARSTLGEIASNVPMTLVVDYVSADYSFLLLLLKLKRLNRYNNVLVVTKNERIVDITENILLDSAADCLIDSFESRQKLNDFLAKGSAGQIVSKSITNKTWAMIKKNEYLTHREIDMFPFIIAGKGNKEISREVDLSEKMVSIHRRNIYSKLHVGNLTGLYHYFTAGLKTH